MPWPANLTQRSNRMPYMSTRVRQGVTVIFWIFAQHLALFGDFFFDNHFFHFCVFDVGKLRCTPPKMEKPIRRLHFEIQGFDLWPSTKMQGVIWLVQNVFDIMIFSLWPLGLLVAKSGVMSPNLVPKYIILIIQIEDKLLFNIERKQTTYILKTLVQPVIIQHWCGISLLFAKSSLLLLHDWTNAIVKYIYMYRCWIVIALNWLHA